MVGTMVMMKKMMMVTEIIMITCASVWLVKTTALHGALWPNAAWSQRGSLPHSTDIPMVQLITTLAFQIG